MCLLITDLSLDEAKKSKEKHSTSSSDEAKKSKDKGSASSLDEASKTAKPKEKAPLSSDDSSGNT